MCTNRKKKYYSKMFGQGGNTTFILLNGGLYLSVSLLVICVAGVM